MLRVSASSQELTLDRCPAAQIVTIIGLVLFPACTAAGMAGTPSLWPYRLVTPQIPKWYRLRVGTLEQMRMTPGAGVGLGSGPGDFRVPGWGIWRLFPSRRLSELLPGFPHGLTHLVPLALVLFPAEYPSFPCCPHISEDSSGTSVCC